LVEASHRWFGSSGELLYEQTLWTAPPDPDPPALVGCPLPTSGRAARDPDAALLPQC